MHGRSGLEAPAAAAAATAAATAAAAAAAAATTAAVSATAAAAGTALFRDVHAQGPAIQIPPIEGSDCRLGVGRR